VNTTGIIRFAIFCVFFAVIAATIFFIATDDGQNDDGFDHYRTTVDITVHEDGSASVMETFDFRWSDTYSGEMYRTFEDDITETLNMLSIRCFIDGREAVYTTYSDGRQATYSGSDDMALYAYGLNSLSGNWELNAFYKRSLSGEHRVVFQYELRNIVTKGADCVDFYYKVFTTFSDDLKDLSVNVTMPTGSLQSETRIFGHGDPNGYAEFVNSTADVAFRSPNLEAYTMFEIRVVSKQTDLYSFARTDNMTFDSILAEEDRYVKEMEMDILLANVQIVLIVVMVLTAITLAILRTKLIKRNKPNFNQPYIRELPTVKPNITAELEDYYRLTKSNSGNKITATILNLALHDVISIEKGRDDDIVFVSVNDRAPMTRFEQSVYSMLFFSVKEDSEKRISLKQLKKDLGGYSANNFRLFETDRSEFESMGYVDHQLNKRNSIWAKTPLIPFAFLFAIFIITIVIDFTDYLPIGFFAAVFSLFLLSYTAGRTPKVLTVKGEDEYAKTQALKRFYTDMTLMKERRSMELPLWEQHLVYATALGVADKVIKELDVRLAELEISDRPFQSLTYMYALRNANGLMGNLSSIGQATNAAFIRQYSFAGGGNLGNVGRGGGGGGFSGGGGGGFGGGGGGHR
jgi:uncharacterized membrane protein